MEDQLRKLLYPLVLPCIVTAVWGYAWTRKYDDQINAGGPIVTFPASWPPALAESCPPPRVDLHFIKHAPRAGDPAAFVLTEHGDEE
jgi:hypothetical protein